MKLTKLFAPLLVTTLFLGACGDSSMSRQDAVEALLDWVGDDSGLDDYSGQEASMVEALVGCLLDGIQAETGDSYEEIVEEVELDGDSTKYDSFADSLLNDCIVDTPEALESALNDLLPEDSQLDLSGVDNFQREALAAMFNYAFSQTFGEFPLWSEDVGYCMADYLADNSGDSHRDILVELIDDGAMYESLAEDAFLSCF